MNPKIFQLKQHDGRNKKYSCIQRYIHLIFITLFMAEINYPFLFARKRNEILISSPTNFQGFVYLSLSRFQNAERNHQHLHQQ
jgi:hypothetical protein